MTRYQYRALTVRGEVVTGEITAPDRQEVLKRIEYLGLIPIETESRADADSWLGALQTGDLTWARLTAQPAKASDVTIFARDLAVLLRSGVRLHQALDLLSDPEMTGALAPTVASLRARVGSGETFSDALAHFDPLFPKAFVSLVRIGETAGNLATVVEALAEERSRMATLRQKVLSSLRYPAFVLCAAFAVLVFFLFFVLPQFADVLRDLGSKVDPVLATLMGTSEYVRSHVLAIGAGTGLVVLVAVFALRTRKARQAVAAAVLRLPGLRSLSVDYNTAVFCRSLGLQLGNGVRLTTALTLLGDVVNDEDERAAWQKVTERVRQGARLGDSLTGLRDLSPVAIRMLRIGEEAGQLAPIAIRAAELFEARLERSLERVVAVIGPVSIMLIATIVGGLAVSLMTSLISIGQLAN